METNFHINEDVLDAEKFVNSIATEEAKEAVAASPLFPVNKPTENKVDELPSVPEPVYTKEDEPTFNFDEPEQAQPTTEQKQEQKEQAKTNDLGSKFFVSFAVDMSDMLMKRMCANMAHDANLEKWALDAEEKAKLTEAADNYVKSIDLEMTPAQVLLMAIAMIYAPRVYMAKQQGNEKKKRSEIIRNNAEEIKTAVSEANKGRQPVKRTNFRIFAETGCYHRDEFNNYQSIEVAKIKPNFEDMEEVKKLIEQNGIEKVKKCFPDFIEVLNQFDNK